MRAKKVIVIEYKSHEIKKGSNRTLQIDTERPCGHMADAAELKDLAWENQWSIVGRRIELLSSPGLPGSSGLNQQGYSNHLGLGRRATLDFTGQV